MKQFTFRINPETLGLFYGFLGVLGFSLTLPATRVAVTDLNPVFVGLGRALVASVFAMLALWVTRQPFPPRKLWGNLFVVAIGVIIGFPLLSAWAMQQLPASHGAIITGLLPLATAIIATIRVGERPSLKFWIASITGSITIVLFVLISSGGSIQGAHILLLGAVITAAIGYAEGGKLASILGGWQVISWALVLMAPILLIPVTLSIFEYGLVASPRSWICFGYVSVISQFVAFFAWYHGMGVAGVARVSQIQLLQPFLTILFSAWLLHEQVTSLMLLATCIVIACIIFGKQASIEQPVIERFVSDSSENGILERGKTYQATGEEVDMVNAALYLRRPLLITGIPGTGKSSLAYSVARELKLGPVLRWNITSRSTLQDGLYRYDAIARLQDSSLSGDDKNVPDIGRYIRLGALGTALLPTSKPRVLLIDEIDKSDIDLPK